MVGIWITLFFFFGSGNDLADGFQSIYAASCGITLIGGEILESAACGTSPNTLGITVLKFTMCALWSAHSEGISFRHFRGEILATSNYSEGLRG